MGVRGVNFVDRWKHPSVCWLTGKTLWVGDRRKCPGTWGWAIRPISATWANRSRRTRPDRMKRPGPTESCKDAVIRRNRERYRFLH